MCVTVPQDFHYGTVWPSVQMSTYLTDNAAPTEVVNIASDAGLDAQSYASSVALLPSLKDPSTLVKYWSDNCTLFPAGTPKK